MNEEIKKACTAYQNKRDKEAPKIVESDSFTMAEINKHSFSKKDKKLSLKFATFMEKAAQKGVDDEYKHTIPVFF